MKRRGGSKFVSSRFIREKKRRTIETELDALNEKIKSEAARFGLDLADQDVTNSLMELACSPDNEELLDRADWKTRIEHFLALSYAQTVIIGKSTSDAEKIGSLCLGHWLIGVVGGMPATPAAYMCTSCIIKQHSSKMGKAGVEKKLGPMRELEQWTVAQYAAGEWPSANKAAHDLVEKVLAHGRSIGANLSKQNAQRTIADWIRKSKKSVPQAATGTRQAAS